MYPTLRRGSRGDYVKIVQQKLGVAVDGIFGPQTEQAVRSFQSNKRIAVDGIVGPQTWSVLMGSGSPSTPSMPSMPNTGGLPTMPTPTNPGVPTTLIDKVLGVFILYGLFKVLQKAL